jgi:hypothetical protein
MGAIVAQYISGAILLIMVYLLLVDPEGTAQIFDSLSNFGTSQINALQGQKVNRSTAKQNRRR